MICSKRNLLTSQYTNAPDECLISVLVHHRQLCTSAICSCVLMSPQYASYGSSEWFTSPPHYFYLFLTLQPRGSAAAGPLHASTPPPLLKIHTHNAHVRVRILDDTDADLVRVNLRQSPL